MVSSYQNKQLSCKQGSDKEIFFMKGYITANGYMGLVEDRYILFASEEDYREFMDC